MKKKYNPFKMWGSWIGAIIFSYPLLLAILNQWQIKFCLPFQESLVGVCGVDTINLFQEWFWIIVVIPIGFLIGWIIHSLLRKFKVVK